MRRRILIAAGVVVFLGISFVIARWLHADTVERNQIERYLDEQNRGDLAAMLDRVECPDEACKARLRANATLFKGAPGEIDIARYDSKTSHAITSETGATRVVWLIEGRPAPGSRSAETVVQCFEVERDGNMLSGASVTLLRVSAPIGREKSCQ